MFEKYDDILTVEELIEILKVQRKTIYNLLKTKKIKSIRVGREYRITKKALQEYIQNQDNEL